LLGLGSKASPGGQGLKGVESLCQNENADQIGSPAH
jgi:hypothetical protein